MKLSSHHLEAFITVVKTRSFSQAAKLLHVTQSALSQRVLNLEEKLQLTLFIRESSGVRLTDAGERLSRYCHMVEKLEEEVLADLLVEEKELNGNDDLIGKIKIAGFSTLVRSLLIPKISQFIRKNPRVQIDIMSRELHELVDLLRSGQADFIFSSWEVQKQEIECHLVGHEKNVLVESVYKNARKDIYIDHDERDSTTEDFWRLQKSKTKESPILNYKRLYFDEIYAIIEAVQEGLGRAVVPHHLIKGNKKVSIVKGYLPLKVPIYLCYFQQAFYTRLQKSLIGELSQILFSN